MAAGLGRRLAGRAFELVLSSPLKRAWETAELTGLGEVAEATDDLLELGYGEYEGRTTADIRTERPDWTVWADGVPDGETAEQVGERADRVLARAHEAGGDVLLVSHGHYLRILAARWVGLAPADGRRLALGPGSVSVLGWERENPVILTWNG